ncbi:MAG: DGQHR domain-containing protein [Ignavibacterium sp.]|jgi:DGQHR domain-containing protein|nr:DGQHR domain-containing protein [Ignavibacterium sp.]
MGEDKLLNVVLVGTNSLKREAVNRRNPFNLTAIKNEDIQPYLDDGWIIEKTLKTKTRLKKQKPFDERLENKLWMLFYRMGYNELNQGRNFQIKVSRNGSETLKKQIDVYAKDEETVIVAECKASNKLGKRSLQKDIEEFANLKGPLTLSIKNYYGNKFKPKIIWLFVTENVIWSKQDKERALGQNIKIITERELRYYQQIADHLGQAARYQFLAEFLKDQQVPGLQNKIVPAIRGKLGGKRFYSFVITPKHLLKLAFVNHRSLNDPEGAPTYQRLISRSRIKQIGTFLKDGGFFPTNILINFVRSPRFDIVKKDDFAEVVYGHLYLPDKYRSIWIIDGQHRLYGFAHLDEKYLNQNIVVIGFEQLPPEDEANLFVTINHEQKSVPKTLLDDLEGELKWGSTEPYERIGAISARLVSVLNTDIGEPFYNRVIQQGITPTDNTNLTVPALKDAIRKSGLVGRVILRGKQYELGPLSGAKDSETLDRARRAINQFFTLVRDNNYGQWESGRTGFLCTNIALTAYMNLFGSLIKYMESNKGLDAKELEPEEIVEEIEDYLEPLLKKISSSSNIQMEKEFKVQFGSGGPPEYYYRLCKIIKEEFSDFEPEGMEVWEAEQSDEKINLADRKIKEINIKVQKYIFDVFKKKYGIAKDAYWNKGVLDKQVKTKAYEKSLDEDDENRLPLENYLDFIEYKKIVENKTHWEIFKNVFDIPEPGEKGLSKNLKWMDRVNALRRIPAHATEKRLYKVEDFDYIDFIYEEFMKRLLKAEKEIDIE